MKRTLILLMAVALFTTGNTLMAHDFEVDGIFYKVISVANREIAVTYRGREFDPNNPPRNYRGEVNVPATVAYENYTYRVTTIGENAFEGCYELTKVTLPNGLLIIDRQAFADCERLTDVDIPATVTGIHDRAFASCKAMKHVVIPASVTGLGDYAFEHCEGVESVRLEDSNSPLQSGYWGVSFDFPNVKSAYIGRNSGGWAATFDATYSWYANGKLEQVEFGPLVTEIPWGFMSTDCFNVTTLTIGANVTHISDGAFSGCTSVQSVVIPDKVKYIGANAFSGGFWGREMGLKELIIGKNVQEIGECAFANCKQLKVVGVKNPKAFTIPENAFEAMTYMNATLYVPIGTKDAYKHTKYWENFQQMEEGDVEAGMKHLTTKGSADWHTIDGIRLTNAPTQRGLYLKNNRKVTTTGL